jgi:hypothetical protein
MAGMTVHATQGSQTIMTTSAPTSVIVVARDEPDEQLSQLRELVAGANVLLVAPALPVPGERWIIDLDARAAQARSRLQQWTVALAGHAATIEGEVGDADPRLAVADARRALPAARVVDAAASRRERPAPRGRGYAPRLVPAAW